VYEFAHSNGGWTEKVIYSFNGADGLLPYFAGVVFDPAGNLYGTTNEGGSGNNAGVVYELKPSQGRWTETVLYSFAGSGGDGSSPQAGVVLDAAGNAYGTTSGGGGAYCGCGTVFEITP